MLFIYEKSCRCTGHGAGNFELTDTNLCLDPYMLDTTEYGTNYGRGTEELTDQATEASEYYTPTYVEISPMSFVIYAKEHGVIEKVISDNKPMEMWMLPDKEIVSLESKSYFIMKDGSELKPDSGWHNTTYPKTENMYSDLMLYSSTFSEVMNVDDFEALVINGVWFEFEK